MHLVAPREQRVDDMGADETGTAGDDDPHRRNLPAMFITLEGLDGSGKTTQATAARAPASKPTESRSSLTREPGGTPLGEGVRDLVLHGGDVAPWAEAALYAAARAPSTWSS